MSELLLVQQAIDNIIAAPSKKYTKTEALEILRQCGILDKNNNVVEAYKDIIVDADSNISK